MNLRPEEYNFTAFDPELALSGNPTAALIGSKYKLVELLEKRDTAYAVEYPYKALIEGEYYYFSEQGYDKDGVQIFMANGIIDSEGAAAGDIQTKTDISTGETTYYSVTSLNYREQVAVQVLNALIGHIDNPFGYNAATIKLLVEKAFLFAVEFTNQAIDLRVSNAEIDPDTGEVKADPTDIVSALTAIQDKLDKIKTEDTKIVAALDGTNAAGVSARLNTGNDRLNTINTTLTTGNTKVEAINTTLGTTNTALSNIKTSIDNVKTEVQTGDANIVNALSGVRSTINSIESEVSGLGDKVDAAKSSADTAATNAADAKSSVDNVSSIVTEAKDAAEDAATSAVDAYTAANSAKSSVDALATTVGGVAQQVDEIHQAIINPQP